MKENLVNSHFIQKAYAKNFAVDGKVHWETYKGKESGVFNITDPNSEHPIAEMGFYSEKIENGLNKIESDGIRVIRKIALEAQLNHDITLTRKQLYQIKYFSLVSASRTSKLRRDIGNSNGDPIFNNMVKSSNKSPQEIQEEILGIYIDKYSKTEEGKALQHKEIDDALKNFTSIKSLAIINLWETTSSRVVIMKFDEPKLLLTESLCFVENNPITGGNLLNFIPIAPNIGIAFYFDHIMLRGMMPTVSSKIFKNDIANIRHEVHYINKKEMNEAHLKYLKDNRNSGVDIKVLSKKFNYAGRNEYLSNDDEFTYRVMIEPEKTADICNAMALVHNEGNIHIFQNKKHINDAEREVQNLGITRIEDMWKK